MDDRELLELAAKAAGMKFMVSDAWHDKGSYIADGEYWDPLYDDGDALRLAVKLGLVIYMPDADDKTVVARTSLLATAPRFMEEVKGSDPYAATRRAIVRAAAEIGRTA